MPGCSVNSGGVGSRSMKGAGGMANPGGPSDPGGRRAEAPLETPRRLQVNVPRLSLDGHAAAATHHVMASMTPPSKQSSQILVL